MGTQFNHILIGSEDLPKENYNHSWGFIVCDSNSELGCSFTWQIHTVT
jgi:hypothetical protein